MPITTSFGSFGTLMDMGIIRQVPQYQRRYSWTDKQVESLWDDVLRLYAARQAGQSKKHFIGPLILGESQSRGFMPSVTQIIDGQQRLMTLSLLMCVLREYLQLSDDQGEIVTNKYLTLRHGQAPAETRISAGRWDKVSYEEAIHAEEEFSDHDSPIAKTYDLMYELLAKGPSSEEEADDDDDDTPAAANKAEPGELVAPQDLATWNAEQLISVITEDLELAIVMDVPEERAYEIFATINAAGLQLSQVDLIRNMIFVNLPAQGAALFEQLWAPMEEALKVDGLDDYLHCWVMAEGHNVSKKNTYSALVEMLRAEANGESAFKGILSQVHAECGYYLLASRPTAQSARSKFHLPDTSKDLLAVLTRLNEWGSKPLEPVLFLIVKKWATQSITADQAHKLCEGIEALVVRRFICAIPPNDLRSSFARMAGQIAHLDGDEFFKATKHEILEPGRRWPNDREVRESAATAPLYRKKPRQCFYVLKRLAESLEGSETPNIRLGSGRHGWSIEHLLPQSLSVEWKSDLALWNYADPTELHQRLKDTLGNLTVTTYNSDASNLALEKKKAKLKMRNHRLVLSEGFLASSEWGEKEIVARSQALAKQALKIWSKP